MFKQRLLTTLILVPLVLGLIYFAAPWVLASIVLLMVASSGWEWSKLVPFQSLEYQLVFVLVLLAMVWFCSICFPFWLVIGLLMWLLVLAAVLTYPVSQHVWGYPAVVAALGLFFLPLFANAVVHIHQSRQGKDLIVYAFALVWAVDIGAYLVGKVCGRQKLIPQVSPGKTLEGALGGFIFAAAVAVVGSIIFKPKVWQLWYAVALIMVLVSMVGDLFVSMLKRRENIKDSGHVLPGHGGLLDRLDSSIAALPIFCYGLAYLEFWH